MVKCSQINAPTGVDALSVLGRFIQRLRRNEPTCKILPPNTPQSTLGLRGIKRKVAVFHAGNRHAPNESPVRSAQTELLYCNVKGTKGAKRRGSASYVVALRSLPIPFDALIACLQKTVVTFAGWQHGAERVSVLSAEEMSECQIVHSVHIVKGKQGVVASPLKRWFSSITANDVLAAVKPTQLFSRWITLTTTERRIGGDISTRADGYLLNGEGFRLSFKFYVGIAI